MRTITAVYINKESQQEYLPDSRYTGGHRPTHVMYNLRILVLYPNFGFKEFSDKVGDWHQPKSESLVLRAATTNR